MLGIIDINQYNNNEKFNQCTGKQYRDQLLILRDLVELVEFKQGGCHTNFNQNTTLTTTTTSLEINATIKLNDLDFIEDNTIVNMNEISFKQQPVTNNENEIFYNSNFFREFKQSIQTNQSLIPSDIARFIKSNPICTNLDTSAINGGDVYLNEINKKVLDIDEKIKKLDNKSSYSEETGQISDNLQLDKALTNDLASQMTKLSETMIKFNDFMNNLKHENTQKINDFELNFEQAYNLNQKLNKVSI